MSDSDARGGLGPSAGDLLDALRRRLPWLVGGLVLGLLLGGVVYLSVPPRYRSEATLLAESRWFPANFLRDPGGHSLRDGLQTLGHRLAADPVVALLVEKLGAGRFGRFEDLADRDAAIRGALAFEVLDASAVDSAVFQLSYTSVDPALARDVVSTITAHLIDEREQELARQATATVEVLGVEVERLRGRLLEQVERLNAIGAAGAARSARPRGSEDRSALRVAELESLRTLQGELAQAESRYTDRHPDVERLRAELRRRREGLSAPFEARLEPAGREVSPEYRSLLRSYESDLLTYESLAARQIDAAMAERLDRTATASGIQVLRAATLPRRPVWPEPALVLGGGAAAGLLLAAALVLVSALRGPVFSRIESLAELSGLPVIAAIPILPARIRAGGGVRGLLAGRAGGRSGARGLAPRLVVATAPSSDAAEQYRRFLPYLSELASPLHPQGTPVVLVTSAEAAEGKSTTVANLAVSAAADAQRRVLLIDADLRRPSLHRTLGLARSPGLSECVRDGRPLADAAAPTLIPNLFVLCTGTPLQNPLSALGDERFLELIDEARREFDVVFIDAPPRLLVADVRLIERVATMVLFVVRADRTSRASVARSLQGLRSPVGVILNGVARSAYRDYYRSDPYAVRLPPRKELA